MTFSRKLAVPALLLLLAPVGRCGDEYQVPWDKLRDTAQRYLEACVKPETRAKMAKKLKDCTEQRMTDSGWDEDTCMRTIMLDWAAGNQGKLKRKEPKAIAQACFYFVTFRDKGYFIPGQIRAALTEDAVDEIFKHLEGEIKAGVKRV